MSQALQDQPNSRSTVSLKELVNTMIKFNASDLHLKSGRPPFFRVNGNLVPAKTNPLHSEDIQEMVFAILNERQRQELEKSWQVDASFGLGNVSRFRLNVFRQRSSWSAAIRMVPVQIPCLETLGVPSVLKKLAARTAGLLLVTGPTGSGKSTTLASLVQHLNETRPIHILTIEDPIEYVFQDNKASITQREVGTDVRSGQEALYSGLRQDPDVIIVGEMRDYETIRLVMTAAETGHLVMSTLHTQDARGAVERILDVAPAGIRNQLRIQLSTTLVGVVAQQLLVKSGGNGRVLATEVMVSSPSIQEAIAEDKLERIPELISSSTDFYQMQTMNQSLVRLVNSGLITLQEALSVSSRPEELQQELAGIVREAG